MPETKKKTKVSNSASKKAPKTLPSERAAILARAAEIGVTEAAAEAGISKWTVFQWRKAMKKSGETVPPLKRKRRTTKSVKKTKTTKKAKAEKVEVVSVVPETPEKTEKVKTKAKVPASKPLAVNSLEFENELLKAKVATLTEQVEKLRAAIAKLA